MENIFNSITKLQEDGLYEIHLNNINSKHTGYIIVKNGELFDYDTYEKYTDKDIFDVEYFEETNIVYYIKVK